MYVMRRLWIVIGFTLASLGLVASPASSQQQAMGAGKEFAARMVQTMRDKTQMTGTIYVAKNKMRTEMGEADKRRIMIVDNGKGVAWVINPDRKEYFEMKGGGGKSPPLPGEPGSPCGRSEGVVCNKTGFETINGRPTERWEIAMTRGKETLRTVVWVDKGLRLPVREELPGGFVRELRDIREGPQPASLFQLPSEYKQIQMPAKAREKQKDKG